MAYRFKFGWEVAWFVLTAVGIVILQQLLTFDPGQITDWRTYLVGIGGASVRAGAGALLAWLGGSVASGGTERPVPPPPDIGRRTS